MLISSCILHTFHKWAHLLSWLQRPYWCDDSKILSPALTFLLDYRFTHLTTLQTHEHFRLNMFWPEFIIHILYPGIKPYLIFPIKDKKVTKWSHSVMSNSLWPHGLQPTRLHRPWDFLGKSTGVGCYFLLLGIFPTQGSNRGLLHCRQMIYPLSH